MGHSTLQKNRLCPITRMNTVKRIVNRMDSDHTLVVPLIMAHGMADSMVATGQSRQKKRGDSVVRKYGTATTKPAKTPYLMNLVHEGILYLTKGIL